VTIKSKNFVFIIIAAILGNIVFWAAMMYLVKIIILEPSGAMDILGK